MRIEDGSQQSPSKMNPLIVYLDSQDFSHFAKPPNGKEEVFSSILAELTGLLDEGRIEIRYSAIHVSEIAHMTVDDLKYSGPRAHILKSLCRGRCMRFWSDIADDEVIANFESKRVISTTDDNDRWFEANMNSLGNFIERAREALDEALKERKANRQMRRKVAKVDLKKLFLGTEQGRAIIDNIVESLNRDFSLTESVNREVLEEYISGSANKTRFEDYLKSIMFDPVSLIARLGPEVGIEQKLPQVVRNSGRDLAAKINPGIDQIRHAVSLIPKGGAFPELWSHLRSMPKTMTDSIRRRLIKNVLLEFKEVTTDESLSDDQLDRLRTPIFNVYADILRRYVSQMVSAAEAGAPPRYFKLSDAADLFHALYIPYVDVFRCDSAWTNILAPQGKGYSTDVVGKIEDLMPTIRRRLAAA